MKKNYYYAIGAIVVLLFMVLAAYLANARNQGRWPFLEIEHSLETLTGEIIGKSESGVKFKDDKGAEFDLIANNETKIFDELEDQVEISYLNKGFQVEVKGKRSGQVSYVAEEIRITKAPNIVVFLPESGQTVNEIIMVRGVARVFESQLNLRMKTSQGVLIYVGQALALAPDAGKFGEFEKNINLSGLGLKPDLDLILEVFDYSAKDGTQIDTVSVPLKFQAGQNLKIKAFFSNNKLDPQISCNKVFPVEREIPRTLAVGRAALEELLKGPAETEKSQGFSTSINPGVKINSLVIENGSAKVDFDQELEKGVGGSCRVSAIRAQITETLKQFFTVKEVVISINGRIEDILQP